MSSYTDLVMGYIGNKRKIAPYIKKYLPKAEGLTFVDGMAGSNIIALTAKKLGFRVITNDVSPASQLAAQAIIENHYQPVQAAPFLEQRPDPDSRVFRDHADQLRLTRSLALFFDNLQSNAVGTVERYLVLWIYAKYMPYNNLIPISHKPVLTDGEFDPKKVAEHKAWKRNFYMINKPTAFAKKYIDLYNRFYFHTPMEHSALLGSVFDLKHPLGDVIYLDPPYPSSAGYDIFSWANMIATNGEGVEYPDEFTNPNKFEASLHNLFLKTQDYPTLMLSIGNWPESKILEIARQYRPDSKILTIPYHYNVNPRSKKLLISRREYDG